MMNLRPPLRAPLRSRPPLGLWPLLAAILGFGLLLAPGANAQWSNDEVIHIASPERFTLELRIGPYEPSAAGITADDTGPLFGVELDYHIWRIPYVGPIGIGAAPSIGIYAADGSTASTRLTLIPFPLLASLRVDVLARELGVPLVLTGKAGLDMIFGVHSGAESQTSFGLRWGLQLALELDPLEPRAARALDEEWGINHSFLFFELFGSTADLGDPMAWAAGLGFTF
ncbi:MAG: hypothetical protein OEY14_14740 [Myxococcales bacterium]|nr:hypothetical protein [Myxococcales bacterium]